MVGVVGVSEGETVGRSVVVGGMVETSIMGLRLVGSIDGSLLLVGSTDGNSEGVIIGDTEDVSVGSIDFNDGLVDGRVDRIFVGEFDDEPIGS